MFTSDNSLLWHSILVLVLIGCKIWFWLESSRLHGLLLLEFSVGIATIRYHRLLQWLILRRWLSVKIFSSWRVAWLLWLHIHVSELGKHFLSEPFHLIIDLLGDFVVNDILNLFSEMLWNIFHLVKVELERLDIVDVIDSSVVAINNLSVANSNSHELLSVLDN